VRKFVLLVEHFLLVLQIVPTERGKRKSRGVGVALRHTPEVSKTQVYAKVW